MHPEASFSRIKARPELVDKFSYTSFRRDISSTEVYMLGIDVRVPFVRHGWLKISIYLCALRFRDGIQENRFGHLRLFGYHLLRYFDVYAVFRAPVRFSDFNNWTTFISGRTVQDRLPRPESGHLVTDFIKVGMGQGQA